ncbi:glycosyltransferase family 2 protein [Pedobacter sp. PF22-3]|uniref:glycosyltransferase family A protein n=1 Tax=Pedobacter sp. PF22-3 TaxID=2994467 RepID=UPI002247FCD6|nr:glycosyltransferase family 2 protein [Pedobacter sp. PF22-3]MCX2494155.1 glycosyltransferase family 2 protein [Pedobacter sp. PF22-3]
MLELQIFISSYNRPDLITKSIDSILNQEGVNFEIIVSDNSTDDKTEKIINSNYNNSVRYIKRTPSVDVISHLNLILNDVKSEYFMIFHDDDIMLSGMLKHLFSELKRDKDVVAVGCNANTIYHSGKIKHWFLKDEINNQTIHNGKEMALRYLSPNLIVPFPSYMYKASVAKSIKFDVSKGGKYCDVAFLVDVANKGKVVMIAAPLMNYYIHAGQDSFKNDFLAKIKLIQYFVKELKMSRMDSGLFSFRLTNIYNELKSVNDLTIKSFFSKRFLILYKYNFRSFIKLTLLSLKNNVRFLN